jgi:hypothetical protein
MLVYCPSGLSIQNDVSQAISSVSRSSQIKKMEKVVLHVILRLIAFDLQEFGDRYEREFKARVCRSVNPSFGVLCPLFPIWSM